MVARGTRPALALKLFLVEFLLQRTNAASTVSLCPTSSAARTSRPASACPEPLLSSAASVGGDSAMRTFAEAGG